MLRVIGAPTDLSGCQLWLDASDLSSITKDGSNLVSQWNDKSGNAKHAVQATGANQPTYSATGFGNRPCLDWGAGAVSARSLATPSITLGTYTAFAVTRGDALGGYLWTHVTDSANGSYIFQRNHSARVIRAAGTSAKAVFAVPSTWLCDATRHVVTVSFGGLHVNLNFRFDGVRLTTVDTAVANPGTATVSGALYVGNNQTPNSPFRGLIAEIVIFDRELSEGEIVLVEQYLAKKWAIAPRIMVSPLDIPDCAMWFDASQGVTSVDATLSALSDFANAVWTKTNLTVAADVAADPFGGTGADRFTDDATSGTHDVLQAATGSFVTGCPTEFSVYLKAGTATWVLVAFNSGGGGAWFNLSTGAIGTLVSCAATIVDAGNGWYKCAIQHSPSSAGYTIRMAPSNGVSSYVGSGSTLFAYGAQLRQGKVSQWDDSSGNARHIVQATDSAKPTYNASNAAFGGKPTVDWLVAAASTRMDRGVADNIAQPLTILGCVSIVPGATQICLFDNVSGGELVLSRQSTNNQWQWYSGAQGLFPAPDVGTKPFTFALLTAGNFTEALARINGVGCLHIVGGTQSITTFRLGTFINGFTNQNWNGSVAEFIVYRRRLNDGEIAAVEAYLKRKYSL